MPSRQRSSDVVGRVSLCVMLLALACSPDEVQAPTSSFALRFSKPAPAGGSVAQLPSLGGPSEAYAVNDLGEVVGFSAAGNPQYSFAVRWNKQGSTWTVTQVGPAMSAAEGINENGTIAGKVGDSAAVWIPGSPVAILGRGEAKAVNAFNIVVGWQWSLLPARPAAWIQEAGVWSMKILNPLPGDTANSQCLSVANAINDAGIIVGIAYDSNCARQTAVAWMPKASAADGWEAATPLVGTETMAQSVAYGIVGNTIAGAAWPCATMTGCQRRAYRWSITNEPEITGPLGTLDARANGLNSAGWSAGSYVDRKMHAVVWAAAGTSYQTLPEIRTYDAHWVWDLSNPAQGSSTRLAVGGALDGRGGRYAIAWTVP